MFNKQDNLGEVAKPNDIYLLKNFLFRHDGSLKAFPKLRKLVDITNPHSVFKISSTRYLVCSNDNGSDIVYEYDKSSNTLRNLGVAGASYDRMWYVDVGGKIYLGNRNYAGMYDGIGLRAYPSSSASDVSFFSASDLVIEATDYDLADIITFPCCEYLTLFLGRIFGVRDKMLWFSEPGFFEISRKNNFFDLGKSVIGMASAGDYLCICHENEYQLGMFNEVSLLSLKSYSVKHIIPNTLVAYKNMFAFLSSEGIVIIKDGLHTIINKPFVDFKVNGYGNVARISDGEYLFGGSDINIHFTDELDAQIIKGG